jgi:dTDP-4-amino-4,6-dideoxygalactose transaminase
MIKIAHPSIGEEEKKAVLEVLESGMLAQGPRVQAFENEFAKFCGVRHAVASSSGTSALHMALLAHGIGAGDEVITSAFTFIASANSILYTGAQPVFVDIDAQTFNLDASLAEKAITSRTKAILPVHLFGLSCNMDALTALAAKHGLALIEDACQSHGATCGGKMVGSFGTGVFSFYPTKNMTAAEGGMITTDDEALADTCRALRQHGMRRRYSHELTGFNYRMSDIHAAIGLAQLRKLQGFNTARRANARYLNEHLHLKGVSLPQEPPGYGHVYHQYTLRVADGKRQALREHLQRDGIDTEIYYPLPLYRQPALAGRRPDSFHLAQTELAAQEVLSLPVHPGLSAADLQQIADSLNRFTG